MRFQKTIPMKRVFTLMVLMAITLTVVAQTTLTDFTKLRSSSLAGMAVAKLEGSGDHHYLYHQRVAVAPRHYETDDVQRVQKECCDAPSVSITHPDDFIFEGFYEGTNELYVVYSNYNRRAKTYGLYVNAVSKTEFTAEWQPQPILTIPDRRNGSTHVRVAISPDGGKAALFIPTSSRDANIRKSTLIVLGDKGKTLWNSILEFTDAEMEYQIPDLSVTNNGTVFLAAISYSNPTRRHRNDETFHLYEITSELITCISQPVDFGYLCNARLLLKANGDIAAGGYFTNNLKNKPQGLFLMLVDRDSDYVKNISYQQFPDEYYDSRGASLLKFKPARMSVEADGLYEFADGSLVMLGEQRETLASSSTSNSGETTTSYFYHCGDILVHFADTTGALGDMSMIHKYQITGPRLNPTPLQELRCYGYSNFVIRQGDSLRIFFADDYENYYGRSGLPLRGFNDRYGMAFFTVTSNHTVTNPELLFNPHQEKRKVSQPLFIDKEGLLVIGMDLNSICLTLLYNLELFNR